MAGVLFLNPLFTSPHSFWPRIRLHTAHIGHPTTCDAKYSSATTFKEQFRAIQRSSINVGVSMQVEGFPCFVRGKLGSTHVTQAQPT